MNSIRPTYTDTQQQQIRDTAKTTSAKLTVIALLVTVVAITALAYFKSGAIAALGVVSTAVTLPFALLGCAIIGAIVNWRR